MFGPEASRDLALRLSRVPAKRQLALRVAVGVEDLQANSSIYNLPLSVRRQLGYKTSKEEDPYNG